MRKQKSPGFFCTECGYEVSKWMGQCPGCKAWNTMAEAPTLTASVRTAKTGNVSFEKPETLDSISTDQADRIATGFSEFDRVLGGGIVRGSLILLGGDPGVGKSTLILQTCRNICAGGGNVLYVSGEESLSQIKMRADRLADEGGLKESSGIKVYAETDILKIRIAAEEQKPDLLVIDSIQTMSVSDVNAMPGSPSQVKEATMQLLRLAKDLGIAVVIIGHVTKEGVVAGPRMLEHMVDAVVYIEGDKGLQYRVVRGVKNRFGSTNEIGVFEMRNTGFVQIKNPSAFMLEGRPDNAPGSVITCLIEGTRPIMIEVQALCCQTSFGFPKRTSSGIDYNRVNLLLAVMEKRTGMNMASQDVYVNIAGGIKANDPSVDLAVILAIAGSFMQKQMPEGSVAFGEVGLLGEVRAVNLAEKRISEAGKLAFNRIICPQGCLKNIKNDKNTAIEYIGVKNISEAIKKAFG